MSEHKQAECEAIRERIEQLAKSERAREAKSGALREHLESCAACRDAYEEIEARDRLLGQWTAPAPRGNIQAMVMSGIAQMERDRREKVLKKGFWHQLAALLGYRFKIPAVATAAVLIILIVSMIFNVVLLGSSKGGRGEEPRQFAKGGEGKRGPGIQVAGAEEKPAIPMTPQPAGPVLGVIAHNQLGGGSVYPMQAGGVPLGFIVIMGAPPVLPGQEL